MNIDKPCLGALVVGLALSFGASAQNISIATGGTGGVYYPMGGGIADALNAVPSESCTLGMQ